MDRSTVRFYLGAFLVVLLAGAVLVLIKASHNQPPMPLRMEAGSIPEASISEPTPESFMAAPTPEQALPTTPTLKPLHVWEVLGRTEYCTAMEYANRWAQEYGVRPDAKTMLDLSITGLITDYTPELSRTEAKTLLLEAKRAYEAGEFTVDDCPRYESEADRWKLSQTRPF